MLISKYDMAVAILNSQHLRLLAHELLKVGPVYTVIEGMKIHGNSPFTEDSFD